MGEWNMENETVRDMMRPILRLASRMLGQACLLPFVCFVISDLGTLLTIHQFNALLLNKTQPIGEDRLPKDVFRKGKYRRGFKKEMLQQLLHEEKYGEDELAQAGEKMSMYPSTITFFYSRGFE